MFERGFDGVFGYLDDFLVVGGTEVECNKKLYTLNRLLRNLGFWISWKKETLTSQCLTYLALSWIVTSMQFRLPDR